MKVINDKNNEGIIEGISLYQKYRQSEGVLENTKSCLFLAYEVILPCIEELKGFSERLIFSNIVQEIEDMGNYSISAQAVAFKEAFYRELFEAFAISFSYKDEMWFAFTSMAKSYLKPSTCEDGKAKLCYEIAATYGYPLSDIVMKLFCDSEGDVHFMGRRPQ